MREIVINKNDSGQRLDKFLKKFMPKLPDGLLYKGLRKNAVRINGRHERSGQVILCEGDVLKLYYSDEFFQNDGERRIVKKTPLPHIVYEDENILIAEKPAGLTVHDDERGTADNLLAEILYYLFQKGEYSPENEQSFRPALCNRLDRNTGGLVIAAKNALALRFINEKIRKREIEKYYACITEGILEEKRGVLTGGLKRAEKKVEITDGEDGKEILTEYKVLKEKGGFSLIEVRLITGRTHQIRAHFASIGHPLRGDIKYGAKRDEEFNHQALFSYKLEFNFKTEDGVENELEYLNGMTVSTDIPNKLLEGF